ncbi:MAG: hypothetical protein RBU37_27235, partial [Myxococcota bacterium]|nr:hypothetical protein [Myxococcota bacterium]
MRALLGTILTASLCLMTSTLWADGGLIPVYGQATQVEAAASGKVSSDGQRALLWRTGETSW